MFVNINQKDGFFAEAVYFAIEVKLCHPRLEKKYKQKNNWILSLQPYLFHELNNNTPIPLVHRKKAKTAKTETDCIYIPKDITVDNNDEEYVETVKNLYQKSLKNYNTLLKNTKLVSEERHIRSVLDELVLVTLNILLVFAENPQKLLSHSRFIEYYQERAACFAEQYVKLTYHVQNPDLQAIETLEEVIGNLKGVFYVEYKRLSETDMSDLTAELKVMEQNLKDYNNALEDALLDKPSLKTNISGARVESTSKKVMPKGSVEAAIASFIEALKGVMIGGFVFSITFLVVVFGIILYIILN